MSTAIDQLKPFLPGLETLLGDMAVSELMINGPHNVWVERAGEGLQPVDAPRLDKDTLERAAIHIARPLGLDPKVSPTIDARLQDGSRVAISLPPASPHVAITIRRFGKRTFSAADLVAAGSLSEALFEAARATLASRRNIIISGGTGSGKTTVANALIGLLPPHERIVSIEDTLELRIDHPNTHRFEARETDTTDTDTRPVSVRSLVRHSLRHRPDHIVVGEIRGAEAADLLQALNTGHGASLTTIHSNTATTALSRLASCAMAARDALPWEVVCRSVVDGIALVLHTARIGGRRVVEDGIYVQGWRAEDNSWITVDAQAAEPPAAPPAFRDRLPPTEPL